MHTRCGISREVSLLGERDARERSKEQVTGIELSRWRWSSVDSMTLVDITTNTGVGLSTLKFTQKAARDRWLEDAMEGRRSLYLINFDTVPSSTSSRTQRAGD
ncbi:MAG: hypothetical protein F4X56_03470 [Gammaproteobacteria bacterium]|nr:hypothetical protein [Gammaproteobacteria bacterium]MYC24960.1 hypothetical protein [Gammaproteobacteria bacterium]